MAARREERAERRKQKVAKGSKKVGKNGKGKKKEKKKKKKKDKIKVAHHQLSVHFGQAWGLSVPAGQEISITLKVDTTTVKTKLPYKPHVETRLKEMTLPIFNPSRGGDVLHGSIKVKGMFTSTVLGTFRCPVAEMPRGKRKERTFTLHDSSDNVSGQISLYLRL